MITCCGIKRSQFVFKTPTELALCSLFSNIKRICFLIGDLLLLLLLLSVNIQLLFLSLLPVVSHQDQFGFGGNSWGVGGSRSSSRLLFRWRWRWSPSAGFLRRVVDGVGCWENRGGRWSRHAVFLRLTDGAERLSRPRKCLHCGSSLRDRAAQERPETPVELHTNTHTHY